MPTAIAETSAQLSAARNGCMGAGPIAHGAALKGAGIMHAAGIDEVASRVAAASFSLPLPVHVPRASRLIAHAIDRTPGAEQTARALDHAKPTVCFLNSSP